MAAKKLNQISNHPKKSHDIYLIMKMSKGIVIKCIKRRHFSMAFE
jgi:hypothetical protein